MTEVISKDVPSYYFILLIVNGFFFCFLSPLVILLKTQPWINPFSGNATETLSSIVVILLISFLGGLPGLLFRDWITGNNGPISILKRIKKGEPWRKKVISPNAYYSIEYFCWLKRTGLDKYLSFLNMKFSLVNGFLIGSGLSLLVNIPIMPILYLVFYDKLFIILISGLSIFFSSLAFLYEKKIFRAGYQEMLGELERRFNDTQNEQILTPPGLQESVPSPSKGYTPQANK